jgi:hypothetical protein
MSARVIEPPLRFYALFVYKTYNQVFRYVYTSTNIIRMYIPMRICRVGHVARMWKKINAYTVVVELPEV